METPDTVYICVNTFCEWVGDWHQTVQELSSPGMDEGEKILLCPACFEPVQPLDIGTKNVEIN